MSKIHYHLKLSPSEILHLANLGKNDDCSICNGIYKKAQELVNGVSG